MWYHKKFKLQYDTNVFNEIIEYAERATWRQGYDQNGLLWNVEELPLSLSLIHISEPTRQP